MSHPVGTQFTVSDAVVTSNDGAFTTTHQWYLGGALVGTGVTYTTDAAGTLKCRQIVTDDGTPELTDYRDSAAVDIVEVTPPTISIGTQPSIATNGTTLTITFSEAVTRGAGYADTDWTLAAAVTGPLTIAYVSGDGTNTWTMAITGGPVLISATDDPVTLDWAGTPDGIEDGAGNDLVSITNTAVANNTTTPSETMLLINETFEGPGALEAVGAGAWTNDQYTPALDGSYSGQLNTDYAGVRYILAAPVSELYGKLMIRCSVLPAGFFITLRDELGTTDADTVGYVESQASSFNRLRCNYSYTTTPGTVAAAPSESFVINTTYYLWLHWKSSTGVGDGIMAVRYNTTDDYASSSGISTTNGGGSPRLLQQISIGTAIGRSVLDNIQFSESLIE